MAQPTGIARPLRKALDVETVRMERSARRSGRVWLLNPRRLEIVLAAAVYPGLHLRSAARLLLQPLPSLRFHVRKLVEHELLVTRSMGGRTALFVPGMYPRSVEPLLAVWADAHTRAVVQALRESPGSAAKRRGALPDVRGPMGRQAVRTLHAAGAIRRTSSRSDRSLLTRRWSAFERLCHEGVEGRLQAFLSILQREDLHPVVDPVAPHSYRISVDGPRSRIRFSLSLDPLAPDLA